APQQGDPLDTLLRGGPSHQSGERVDPGLPAPLEREHLRVAAPGTAERAPLHPDREPAPRPLRLRARDHLRQPQPALNARHAPVVHAHLAKTGDTLTVGWALPTGEGRDRWAMPTLL